MNQWNQAVGVHEDFVRFFTQHGAQAQILRGEFGSHGKSLTKIIKAEDHI